MFGRWTTLSLALLIASSSAAGSSRVSPELASFAPGDAVASLPEDASAIVLADSGDEWLRVTYTGTGPAFIPIWDVTREQLKPGVLKLRAILGTSVTAPIATPAMHARYADGDVLDAPPPSGVPAREAWSMQIVRVTTRWYEAPEKVTVGLIFSGAGSIDIKMFALRHETYRIYGLSPVTLPIVLMCVAFLPVWIPASRTLQRRGSTVAPLLAVNRSLRGFCLAAFLLGGLGSCLALNGAESSLPAFTTIGLVGVISLTRNDRVLSERKSLRASEGAEVQPTLQS